MDNQHKKITGYRDLLQSDIDMMNEIKALEAKWNALVDRLRANTAYDQRNVSLAQTYCEDGFSRAVRAVAQPLRVVDNG